MYLRNMWSLAFAGRQPSLFGGSYAATSPFSSYTSLLAEVGIMGFIAMVLVDVAVSSCFGWIGEGRKPAA